MCSCADVTEFGSNLSTIYADGHVMLPTDPLDTDSAWVCEKTGASREAEDVKEEMARIGMELEVGGIKNIHIDFYRNILQPLNLQTLD